MLTDNVSGSSSTLDICWMDDLVFLKALHLYSQMLLCSNSAIIIENNTVISRPFWGDRESLQAPANCHLMSCVMNRIAPCWLMLRRKCNYFLASKSVGQTLDTFVNH